MDNDNGVYPRIVNEELNVCMLTLDDVNNVGDDVATLFSSSAPLIISIVLASDDVALTIMNHSCLVTLISVVDLLSRRTSFESLKLCMANLCVLLELAGYVSLSCLPIIMVALAIFLVIRSHIRRSLIMSLWFIIGLF